MTATERIATLKAKRREELRAAEEAANTDRERARQQAAQEFEVDVMKALTQLDAAWLAEFRNCGAPQNWMDDDGHRYRKIAFDIPGHRKVFLTLEWSVNEWEVSRDHEPIIWTAISAAGTDSYAPTLADALIAAEGEFVEPLPF